MKNSTKYIGKKILELRKAKRLTQSELCGTEITRNHLSLIESGKALPSLGAVCYLADRLEVPVGFFFSDEEKKDSSFINYFALDGIKEAFKQNNYDLCISLAEEIPPELLGDEVALLYARSCFFGAIHSARKLQLSQALTMMKKASEISRDCCYSDPSLPAAAEYYRLLFTSVASETVPPGLRDLHEASSYVPAELIMYFKAITENGAEGLCAELTQKKHKQHAEAVSFMRDGKMEEAFGLLHELSEFMTLPYYMEYRVYDSLEECAYKLRKYESAYSAAKRKLELKNL